MNTQELADIIRPGTGRGLDFVILDELRKRTGIMPYDFLKWAVSEMLCNSLDTDATIINVEVETEGKFDIVKVRDNGSKKISLKEIKLILDFTNKASSKRGFLRVSRGYLGNALKCIFGYSYALAEAKELEPQENIIISHGTEYRIKLKPDRIKEFIDSDVDISDIEQDSFTTFIIRTPIDRSYTMNQLREISGDPILERKILYDVLFASSMVNPTRKINYDLWGQKGFIGEPAEGSTLRQETSILWYEPKQFKALFFDFVRAYPEAKLKDFITLFRGFTAKKLIREILQELNTTGNHDSENGGGMQFFPATQIQELSEKIVEQLYFIMRERAKPISKRSIVDVLGIVGEERFEKLKVQLGWRHLKYTCMIDHKETDWFERKKGYAKFPFIVELAVFNRTEDDNEGLKIYQCVNFMASMEDLFSQIFNIKYRLGRVGITREMPVTVLAHLICPVLKWLNYGKSGLDE